MKLSSWLISIAVPAIVPLTFDACSSTSPVQPQSVTITLDKTEVADLLGNHDGVTTAEELANLDEYFSTSSEAWCVTCLGNESWTADAMTPSEEKSYIESMSTQPYSTEGLLRRAYIGKSLRTPFVGIAVLTNGDRITVTSFYRAPGPNISGGDWVQLNVKE